MNVLTKEAMHDLLRPRRPDSHKGDYGRALLVAGSRGMMGAALLSSRACMRSGVGLLTVRVPACGYEILQLGIPEAKCDCDVCTDHHSLIVVPSDTEVLGIGPGLGQHPDTQAALLHLLEQYHGPMVLDADALNILALHPDWLDKVPPRSILTPHVGEMKRLGNDPAALSQKYRLILVVKSHQTHIYLPDGTIWCNTEHGNAGMAVGGSGDVLTGILLALLAQHYSPEDAARLGVWMHALAGDLALADHQSMESLLPSDLIDHLGRAFRYTLADQ